MNELLGLPAIPTMLVAGLLLMLVLIVGVIFAAQYDRYQRRLPKVARLGNLDERISTRKEELTDLEGKISTRQSALSELEKNQAEAGFWEERVKLVKEEWERLDERRAEIARIQEEVRAEIENRAAAERQAAEMRVELAEIETRLDAAKRLVTSADAAHASRVTELAELTKQIEQVRNERDEARRLIARGKEAQELTETAEKRREKLKEESEALKSKRDELHRETTELEPRALRAGELKNKIRQDKDRLSELQSDVRRTERELDALKVEWDELHRKVSKGRQADPDPRGDKSLIGELMEPPACLTVGKANSAWSPKSETDALEQVESSLRKHDLRFDTRVIRAFHTALKINDISPITVLAGISGTGKSQLPRRYAEAMGIHFLQVSVQPRWDSPQDLMGFYNYMEGRYRATDLARALVHFDTRTEDWRAQAEQWEDRMLLVLLDEMNLARVEYYFSEFLSRLEMRPRGNVPADDPAREDARIGIDLPAQGENRRGLSVYPDERVLFVGTMNEDESTQSLSDKVLDRANVLRFPKPSSLRGEGERSPVPSRNRFLPRKRWDEWIRDPRNHQGVDWAEVRRLVEEINGFCHKVGRAFGHRMQQAISAYIANYPSDSALDWKVALADQIEMRILPKLRGLDVELYGSALDDLRRLAGEQLEDEELAKAIQNASAAARSGDGLFVWPGLQRES